MFKTCAQYYQQLKRKIKEVSCEQMYNAHKNNTIDLVSKLSTCDIYLDDLKLHKFVF